MCYNALGGEIMKTDKETIEKLRRDLPTIRNLAGWSAARLADLLGVTRATIVTIENTEYKMSVIQYLAIRKLLDEEIKDSSNQKLAAAIDILVDREDVSESDKCKLRDETERIAKRVGRKAGSKVLSECLLSEIPPEYIQRGREAIDRLLSKQIPLESLKEDKNE